MANFVIQHTYLGIDKVTPVAQLVVKAMLRVERATEKVTESLAKQIAKLATLQKAQRGINRSSLEHVELQKRAKRAVAQHVKQLDKLELRLANVNSKLSMQQTAMREAANQAPIPPPRAVTAVDDFSGRWRRVTNEIKRSRQALDSLVQQAVVLAATMVAVLAPVKKFSELADVMANVEKAVNNISGKQLENLRQTLIQMSKGEVRLPSKELAAIAAEGGRAGVAYKDLAGFIKQAAIASTAFEINSIMAAESLAKISKKMKIPISRVNELTDAIAFLENNTTTKAPHILNVLGRVSGEMALMKMPPEAAAGLSAFALEVEHSPELAASGLRMMLTKMRDIPGMMDKMAIDPLEAVTGLLKRIGTLSAKQQVPVVKQLFKDEAGRFVIKALTNMELLDKDLALVAKKSNFAGQAAKEFAIRMKLPSAHAAILSNKVNAAAVALGEKMLPVALVAATLLGKLAEVVEWAAKNTGPLVPIITSLALALALLTAASIVRGLYLLGAAIVASLGWFGVIAIGIALVTGFAGWLYKVTYESHFFAEAMRAISIAFDDFMNSDIIQFLGRVLELFKGIPSGTSNVVRFLIEGDSGPPEDIQAARTRRGDVIESAAAVSSTFRGFLDIRDPGGAVADAGFSFGGPGNFNVGRSMS